MVFSAIRELVDIVKKNLELGARGVLKLIVSFWALAKYRYCGRALHPSVAGAQKSQAIEVESPTWNSTPLSSMDESIRKCRRCVRKRRVCRIRNEFPEEYQ
ncbi:hypothetical protein Tco_0697648 [Tanacetum coccineum]